MSTRLSDLALERYALGELSPGQQRAVEAELERSPDARARLEAIEESNRDILTSYPVARMSDQIHARAGTRRRWTPGLFVAMPVVAAAAAALLLTVAPEEQQPPLPGVVTDVEVTRAKGLQPTLFLHRQTSAGSERLEDGAVAAEHDVLQVSYLAAGRDHGAILSIDGRGTVTLHHPGRVDGDTTLLPAGEAALPHAYELDDAPAFERFFFVTAPIEPRSSLDAAAVVEAAKQLAHNLERARAAPLPLPSNYQQTSVLVSKSERVP